MRNLITDVEGVLVGAAQNERLASGVSVVVFGEPAVASIAVHGGAPGLRDGALLEPEMTVPSVDAIVLSGGSAFGLDAPGGVQARLLETGRGYRIGSVRVPIVPGAILFDLGNGGDKNWDHRSPYWNLGYEAAVNAGEVFALGTAGVGYGLTTYDLKGGLGSTSAVTSNGFVVGALVGVNAVGRATRGSRPHFWAAPFNGKGNSAGSGKAISPQPKT
jgi:D-aminopeptidase